MGKRIDVQRIKSWKEAFTDETTGIHQTISDMLWNFAVFRTANRIVFLENTKRRDEFRLNQIFFETLKQGYWYGFLAGTRRLLDRGNLNGHRGVYSLRSVLNDIKVCIPWLTREVYIKHVCDAEYDLEGLRQADYEALVAAKSSAYWGDPRIAISEYAHKYFDELSDTDESNRSPNDTINPDIFERIEQRLAQLDGISDHVSTHLAHAGNLASRVNKGLDEFDLRDAEKTLQELKIIADLTGLWFARNVSGPLAHFNGNKFYGLDQPMIQTSEIKDLEDHWLQIENTIDSWQLTRDEL